MIGSGMPISQSSAPLPKPMSASCMMEFYALTGRRFQPGNCGTQYSSPPSDLMRRERTAAGDGPAGNEHVLRGVLAGCGDCIKILDLDGSS